jgi:hypothetical protein
MDGERKVVVIPIDEDAIREIRAQSREIWRHTREDGVRRPKYMSIPEDNWDNGQSFEED